MLSVEIDGGVELRSAMKRFTPDLAKQLDDEMRAALRPIVRKARGFVPAEAPLTQWNIYSQEQKGRFPWFNSLEVRRGIYETTETPAPNRKGFSYAASILNTTAGGGIYETAGRKNPNGRKQAPMADVYTDAGTPRARLSGKRIRSGTKNQSRSNNPNAGKQFINAMPPLYKSERVKGQSGRRTKRFDGRLIFRAWGEDQGRANNAALFAVDKAIKQFHARTRNRYTGTMKKAA